MITPDVGVVIAGKYELERPLARGGMGSVWTARHSQLGVEVAIKFMDPSLIASADARKRFEREARAAAHLDSVHVVAVRDYGVEDETPYLVMELLRGTDLAGRLQERGGRLSLPEVVSIASQMAKALRKAHELGLVHRDLKPQNVFLAAKDGEEVVKLLDFGIAKLTSPGAAEDATKTGTLIGSVHYMSPEQARGSRSVDQRSDLWSLGVILFRALTGTLPFRGEEVGDVIVKICAEPIPIPSQIAPDLPAETDRFFERALARDPGARFQSAKEMADALLAIANDAMRSGRWMAQPQSAVMPSAMQIADAQERPAPTQRLVMQAVGAATQQWQLPQSAHDAKSVASNPVPGASTLSPMQATRNTPPRGPGRTVAWVGVGVGSIAMGLLVYFLGRTFTMEGNSMHEGTAPASTLQPDVAQEDPRPFLPVKGPERAIAVEDASAPAGETAGSKAISPAESAPVPAPSRSSRVLPAAPTKASTGATGASAVPGARPAPPAKATEKRLALP